MRSCPLQQTSRGSLWRSNNTYNPVGPRYRPRRAALVQLQPSLISRRSEQSNVAPPQRLIPQAAAQDAPVISIPQSQEEAIAEAAGSLAFKLKPLLSSGKKTKRGFGASGPRSNGRFAIELPIADTSAAGSVQLAQALLSSLPKQAAGGYTIVYADPQAAVAAARSGQPRSQHLQQACRATELSGPLLLVGPTAADVALVEQLLDEVWSGPYVVAINPTWLQGTPPQYQQLVDSFDPVYSFLPIALQGLLRGKEGAVLRRVGSGSSSAPWQVLVMTSSGAFQQIGQMKQRPQQSDLELIFMNASAASSPLTSVVKSVKGMFSKN